MNEKLKNFEGEEITRQILSEGWSGDGRSINEEKINEIYKNTVDYQLSKDYIIPIKVGSHESSGALRGYVLGIEKKPDAQGRQSLWAKIKVDKELKNDIAKGRYPSLSVGLSSSGYTEDGNQYGAYLDHIAMLGEERAAFDWLETFSKQVNNLYSQFISIFSTKGKAMEIDEKDLAFVKDKCLESMKNLGECAKLLAEKIGKPLSKKEEESFALVGNDPVETEVKELDEKEKSMETTMDPGEYMVNMMKGMDKEKRDEMIKKFMNMESESALEKEEEKVEVKEEKEQYSYKMKPNPNTIELVFNSLVANGNTTQDQKSNFSKLVQDTSLDQATSIFSNMRAPYPMPDKSKTSNIYSTSQGKGTENYSILASNNPEIASKINESIAKNGFGKNQ